MATGQAQGDKEQAMADSLVQRLEQLIGQWREQIASDVTTITRLDNEADPGWTMQQSLAWRYGRQTECVEALAEVCRAWQAEQGWRDTLLSEAFDALGHVSAKEWRELGVNYAKLRLQYERRIVVPSPPGREE